MQECSICGEEKSLAVSSPPTCHRCYLRSYDAPKHVCSVCGKLDVAQVFDDKMAVCGTCYEKGFRPKHICSICGQEAVSKLKTDQLVVCSKCYDRFYRPTERCLICGKTKTVKARTDGGAVCAACYRRPSMLCYICKTDAPVRKHVDGNPLCRRCFDKWRFRHDDLYRLKEILKSKIRKAFRLYSCGGKRYTSKKYGIDFNAIIQHVGECPGDKKDYHIDHIFPLVAFDLDDPVHIRAAFAPQNHRWLLVGENLAKGDRYDAEALCHYLKGFENEQEVFP